jgi:kynurenine formamidase
MESERNRGWLHFMQSAFGARCVFALFFFFTGTIVSPAGEPSLWKLQKLLASKRYVDLTHEFAPGIPRWPGFPNETRKTIYWCDKRPDTMGTGFFSEVFKHVGQWGTHVDPPAHFIKGLRTVDQIDPKEMILPLVVIDVHREAAADPDYMLSLERVKKWEKDHGEIPSGAFVAMRTDWSKRWPEAAKMENKRREGRCPLSRMESAGAEISLRRTKDHRLRSRNNRHRSGNGHE